MNGSRNMVAVIEITGDGSGDESGTKVIDITALTGSPATFKIKSVNWDLDGFSASLKWDATVPILALALPTYGDEMDFFEMGAPLVNNAGAGVTGSLLLDTVGLGASGRGTIVINGYH
jgi:hypothetical protein